jgi:prophage DNA circulation protein
MAILDQIFSLSNPLLALNNYFAQLHPAFYNQVPFYTRSNTTTVGRRNAEHIYPFRDTPWMEDIGRGARRYSIIGFMVGDDVIAQRDRMQRELERAGPGVLVHPTYGRLIVNATNQCRFEENMTHGRVIEMHLVFEESGERIYPSSPPSTGTNLIAAATSANQAVSNDFAATVTASIKEGALVAGQALQTASVWIGDVQSLATDATNIYHLGANISGSFGRFFGAKTGSGNGSISGKYTSPTAVASQISNLISTASSDRAAITSAANSAISALGAL